MSTYAGSLNGRGDASGLCGGGFVDVTGVEQQYRGLHIHAVLGQFFGSLSGRKTTLRNLTEDTEGYRICGQRHVGAKTVNLDRIIGSEGRSRDFDSSFRPLKTHTRQRWFSVARAYHQDVPLPAVDLIQVGDAYYVRDGNHRVSVSKARGVLAIDANVTELFLAPRTAQEVAENAAGWIGGRTAMAGAAA